MKRKIENITVVLGCLLLIVLVWIAIRSTRVLAAGGTYQEVENWAQLPAGTDWGVMSAVGVDSKDNVYAFKRSEPGQKENGVMSSSVLVFDSHGKFLQSWGQNIFSSAHGLRVGLDNLIWITDRTGDQVFKFSSSGELLMTLGQKGVAGSNDSHDALNGPSDVVIGTNGDIFVSDGESPNTRVVKFSKDGKFIKYWGTKGNAPGQFTIPHNITLDPQGRLWVCDRGNKRIQVFDQDGNFLEQMTQFGTPSSVFIAKDGTVYVADGEPENQIVIGNVDGTVSNKIQGLKGPHWVAADSTGAVYVAETAGQSIRKFAHQ